MRIIWVDDDVGNLGPQQEFLQESGFRVELVDNVDTAWDIITSHDDAPTGMILDIMMATGQLLKGEPTKGGLTTGAHFLRKLETEGHLSKIRVMVYTIVADPDAKAETDRLGISFYRKQSAPGKRLVSVAISEFGAP